jgi:hypothetical protein
VTVEVDASALLERRADEPDSEAAEGIPTATSS